MNILIAAIYGHNSYSRGIMPDVLQSQIDKNPNATIYYLTNSNTFDVCYFNIEKKPEICYRCKTGVKNSLKLINGNYQHLKISEIATKSDYAKARKFFSEDGPIGYDKIYENFEIGEATLSTYISRTRDRDLLHVNQSFVKELAVNALVLYLAVSRFLEEKEIDVVYNFNGRHGYVRAVMRAATLRDIDCYNIERTRLNGNIDYFKNTLPQDVHYRLNLVKKYWDDSQYSEAEKEEIGATFYKRQRLGESVIYPSYTGKMKKGKIPNNINNGNKNLVLFSSSDDEMAALGNLYKNPFFKNQNEGIKFLAQLIGENLKSYNLIIRMHPNLAGVEKEYVYDIRNLNQKFPNIFVIKPESAIDSYKLMEIADKVISFGSTTGMEANFMRKPVILLGICKYYYSNVAYVPDNIDEIEGLLKSNLKPKPLLDTLKFGFYYQAGGEATVYYNEPKYGEGVFFKNKRVFFYSLPQRIKAKLIEFAYQFLGWRIKL